MMRLWLFGLASLVSLGVVARCGMAADKAAAKKPIETFTSAEASGPDFLVQGEYEGEITGQGKCGAQVIADGDGAFTLRLLAGGLPGAGWDGKTQSKASGKSADGKTTFRSSALSGQIADGKLSGKTSDGHEFTLHKVERKSPTLGAKPPAGAEVLFDGSSADAWERGSLVEGYLLSPLAKGNIVTKKPYKDFKLHLEFRTPFMPRARGQARGNSGLYLQDRYECQVLDSFALAGKNNECGGFYTLTDPLVNMCLPPLAWQTYDIDFKAARFDAAGKKTANAVVTVLHNGVIVHDKLELPKETPGGKKEEDSPLPLQLQNHGNPVYYRNIWIK